MHPLRISDAMQLGLVGRYDCSGAVGPHKSKESRTDAAAIASELSRMHTRTALWTKITEYRILAWRSPPNGDHRCPSHLSPHVRSNVRGTTLTNNSDSQFTCPQRGRKRLSREATLHAVLALEWPELVQIGRCKVQWLPNDANKRILTSFYSNKTIYTTTTQDQRKGMMKECTPHNTHNKVSVILRESFYNKRSIR